MPAFFQLSSSARDVLMQLFVAGPAWDGAVISKSGRDTLVEYGFAEHRHGWAYLTRAGVELAIAPETRMIVREWKDKRFYHKIVAM